MQSKLSQEARQLKASMRGHLKRSRAIAMLGFELEAVSQGRASLRLDVEPRHKQLNNAVHGGILAALADTAGALPGYTPGAAGGGFGAPPPEIKYLGEGGRGRTPARGQGVRTVGPL